MSDRAAHLRGVLLMIAAVGVFAVMDAMMKHMTERYPPLQVSCLRGAASLPFVLIAAWLTGGTRRLRPVRWRLYLVRAAFGIFMFWTFLYALSRSSMADTYAVYMSAPLLVVLCASLLLGEKIGRHVWIAIFAGLAGVIVMLRPSASGFVSLASLAAFASALAYAIVVVMVRIMARTESTPAMVFWYLLVLALGAGLLAVPGWVQIAPGGAGGEHDGLHERGMGANPTPAAKRKSRAGENSPALCRQAGHFFRYSASQSKTVRCQSSLFCGLSTQWPSSGK